MAVDTITWDPTKLKDGNTRKYYLGYDVHILRNSRPTDDMRNYLWAQFSVNSVNYPLTSIMSNIAPPGLPFPPGAANDFDKISFIPNLKGAAQFHIDHLADPVNNPQPFTKRGVKINTTTGVIWADPSADANYLKTFNFVVTVTMSRTGGAPSKTTNFRVHVHDTISSAWMTPSTMDAIAEEPDHMFSIYAEFSDGTIGDITFHEGITWAANNGNIAVDSTGIFTPNIASIPIQNLKITANIGANTPINNIANTMVITSGNVTVLDSWQNPTAAQANRPRVEFVGGPGQDLSNDYSNLLIISEGFTNAEKGLFHGLASDIRSQMRTMVTKKPWNLVSDSINFWSLFLPSQQQECTLRNEQIVYQKLLVNKVNGGNVETTIDKLSGLNTFISNANKWLQKGSANMMIEEIERDTSQPINSATRYRKKRATAIPDAGDVLLLSRLIDKVGLATPYDALEPIANLRTKWRDIYDATITTYDIAQVNGSSHVVEDVYKYWKKTGDRRMINHRNTAFKFEYGDSPPRTDNLQGVDRSLSFGNLRLKRSNVDQLLKSIRYGPLVGDPIIGTNWARTGAPFPADFDLVIFLVRGPRRGGTRTPNADDDKRTDCIGVSVNPITLFAGPTAGAGRQLEITPAILFPLMHADRIGTITHELGHAFHLDDEYGNKTASYNGITQYNLSKLSEVQSIGILDSEKIKWRWLRIAAAGVTTDDPDPVVGGYNLTLKASHLAGFAEQDTVRLRRRELGPVQINNQVPSTGVDPQYSDELTILQIDVANNIIKVAGLTNPNDFPSDSILVKLISAQVKGLGQVTVDMANKTVTGANTWFLTQVDEQGDGADAEIIVNGNRYLVQSVTNDTSIALKQVQLNPAPPSVPVATDYFILPKENYAELMNNSFRLSIAKNKKPMTIEPYVPPLGSGGSELQEPEPGQLILSGNIDIYSKVKPGMLPYKIVGLFSGGDTYRAGLYHPTGHCAMRDSDSAVMFCPVCRYVMVDQIDPSKHGNIDADYITYNDPGI